MEPGLALLFLWLLEFNNGVCIQWFSVKHEQNQTKSINNMPYTFKGNYIIVATHMTGVDVATSGSVVGVRKQSLSQAVVITPANFGIMTTYVITIGY